MQSEKFDAGLIELLTETSWEVCNKIGGIYTVLSTKAKVLQKKFGDKLVFIGPLTQSDPTNNPYFKEDTSLFNNFEDKGKFPFSIKIKTGRWNIPGSPQVILIDFKHVFPQLDAIFGLMWEQFGVESIHEYGDYREGCAFSIASAIVIKSLQQYLKIKPAKTIAHFNEWTTGMGLLYLRYISPETASIFTTHATSIGRSICGNGKPLYDYFEGYHGDQMAHELNMEAKHSLEKNTAKFADCFTAVSRITARECAQLLDKAPDVVTPNGFEPEFVPQDKKYLFLRSEGRSKILKIASILKNRYFSEETLIIATSGRNEYRNKGLDIFLDSMKRLDQINPKQDVIALVLVPAWVKEPNNQLKSALTKKGIFTIEDTLKTHSLNNEESDLIASRLRELKYNDEIDKNVNIIYFPCYLNGGDGIFNISYYDILPALDLTVFPSYYEPWGYTPLESIAFGIPTITSDKSGFGQWILSEFKNDLSATGVKVIERTDSNYETFTNNVAELIKDFENFDFKQRANITKHAVQTAEKADWSYFIAYYEEAFKIAIKNRDSRIDNF